MTTTSSFKSPLEVCALRAASPARTSVLLMAPSCGRCEFGRELRAWTVTSHPWDSLVGPTGGADPSPSAAERRGRDARVAGYLRDDEPKIVQVAPAPVLARL